MIAVKNEPQAGMTTPMHESSDRLARWTATTVAMDWNILDRVANQPAAGIGEPIEADPGHA